MTITDTRRIWGLTGSTAILAALAWSTVDLSSPSLLPMTVPWPVLFALFFAAEFTMVRLHFRSEAHEFNLTDVPLVVGVFLASPVTVLATSIAANLFWKLARRQPVLKAGFNLASGALEAGIAVAISRAVLSTEDTMTLRHGAGGLVAVLAATLVSSMLVAVVIALAEGQFDLRSARRSLGLSAAFSSTSVSLALGAVAVLVVEPLAALSLAPAVAVAFFSYRTFTRAIEESGRLAFVAEVATAMAISGDVKASLCRCLRMASQELGAGAVDLVVFTDVESETVRFHMRSDDQCLVRSGLDPGVAASVAAHLRSRPPTQRWSPCRPDHVLAPFFHARRFADAIVAPLDTESGPIGLLTVANRSGDVPTWTEADRQLAVLIAQHVAAFVRSTELSEALSAMAAERKRVLEESQRDQLTGLANRRGLESALASWSGDHDEAAVLYIDLDDFKTVNDSYGHQVGDRLLAAVGERLAAVVRPGDVAARVGGDEFVLVLDHVANAEALDQIADRVRRTLLAPVQAGPVVLQPGASVGAATGHDLTDLAELVPLADAAMYEAKQHKSHARPHTSDARPDTIDLTRAVG